jgi:bifunctional non-homologous end joining protein LigD
VPLNSAVTYEATQPFAKAIADLLAQQQPKLVVSQMSKALRAKRIFIDWSQNSDFKTTAGVYSLRAKGNHPFVSLPVEWAELEAAMSKNDVDSLYFNPEQAIARAKLKGDLFKPVLSLVQKLPREVTAFLQKQAAQQKRLADKQLTPYVRKRDFTKTKEPNPSIAGRSRQGSRRRFVIQKHAASHLHYDFRLEMHNVLKSWAVPKGPPYKVSEPRLAMPTEDHPIEYLDFEGIIPKGQYGGGTVMVWDIGTYNLIEGNYYKGYLKFFLSGVKLKGEWTLQRLPERDRDKWQLLKSGANTRSLSAKRDDQSALTNRTMAEIRSAADAQWQSNRAPVR